MTASIPNNKTVWKLTLQRVTIQDISLPANAKILHFASQNNEPTIWFHCDRLAAPVLTRLLLAGTDSHVPDNANYIGTELFYNDQLVLHLFTLPLPATKEQENGNN